MSFIKFVLAFTAAFILSFVLAAVAIFCFVHPSCGLSFEQPDRPSVERSAEELYAQYMELSPVERIGKQRTLLSKAGSWGLSSSDPSNGRRSVGRRGSGRHDRKRIRFLDKEGGRHGRC